MKIIKFLGYLVAFILLTFYSGFVVKYLWNGFISTTFGVVNINIYQALGIDLLVSFIVYDIQKNQTTDLLKQMAIS